MGNDTTQIIELGAIALLGYLLIKKASDTLSPITNALGLTSNTGSPATNKADTASNVLSDAIQATGATTGKTVAALGTASSSVESGVITGISSLLSTTSSGINSIGSQLGIVKSNVTVTPSVAAEKGSDVVSTITNIVNGPSNSSVVAVLNQSNKASNALSTAMDIYNTTGQKYTLNLISSPSSPISPADVKSSGSGSVAISSGGDKTKSSSSSGGGTSAKVAVITYKSGVKSSGIAASPTTSTKHV